MPQRLWVKLMDHLEQILMRLSENKNKINLKFS